MAVDERARRAYQDRTTGQAVAALHDGHDVIVIAPTGSGKTNMALSTIRRAQMAQGEGFGRTLFVQDRIALAEQNFAAAERAGMQGNGLWIDGKHPGASKTAFASIDTALRPGADLRGISLLVVDEYHHAGRGADDRAGEYGRLIDRLTAASPGFRVLGLSASETRTDEQPLHPRLESATRLRVTHHEAMTAGAIVPVTTIVPYWRLAGGSRPTVHEAIQPFLNADDPSKRDDGIETMMRRRRPADFLDFVVDQTGRHAPGLPTFAYASRTDDADELARRFRAAGITAESIHYKRPAGWNKDVRRAFDRGDIAVLTSVDMLTEGVDSTKVQAIVNAKEVTSHNDQMQMVGRALRAHTEIDSQGRVTYDKPRAINIDFGATSYVHGTPEASIALESLAHHGRWASPTRLWKEVAGEPHVLALQRGTVTIFAVGTPMAPDPERRWAMFVRDDLGGSGKGRGATSRLKRAPTPWASDARLEEYERDQARAHPRHYVLRESQAANGRIGWENPAGTRAAGDMSVLQAMSEASYRQSSEALRAMAESLSAGSRNSRGGIEGGRKIRDERGR